MSSCQMQRPLSAAEGFIGGAVAGCIAVTFTNPSEVAKTRLQLQGELAKRGGAKVYNNVADTIAKTWRNEGLHGIQRGLVPAYGFQIALNGCRLGLYEPTRRALNRLIGHSPGGQLPATSVIAGAVTGMVGGALGNPLFLVKARMQAYSPVVPVGTQHYYKNSVSAFAAIVRESGILGLARGVDAALLRCAMGSSVQLPVYNWTKNQIVKRGWAPGDSVWVFMGSSTVSGACVCLVMQPADTTLTRMYNQPIKRLPNGKEVGVLYKSPIDCLWKTLKTEGVLGWYKGSTAHFLRITPHTILTLTANDLIVNLYRRIRRDA